jgi:hypothetical protein
MRGEFALFLGTMSGSRRIDFALPRFPLRLGVRFMTVASNATDQ